MITIDISTAVIVALYTLVGVVLIKKNPHKALSLLLIAYIVSAIITSKISEWYSFSLLIPLLYYGIFLQITQNIIKYLENKPKKGGKRYKNMKGYRILVFIPSSLGIVSIPMILETSPFGGVLLWFIILLAPIGLIWSMLSKIDELASEI
ncbi:hypothetical protein [Thermococcus thioreducens]|uniref:Uncharacterized protein n=1 Tax=Thermococcus thioreducens TaxID=277988 RepID=A0A1I0P232_9EURY|nr:hypothetical protein [Thermococcus thioreducens]ASJ12118.1 hypothetical protein A3L14_04135 [Thermococcus thioreducens]SEW08048.1 hypothetical protein SAMN05216170_1443 [Thermococcus thioreducens]